MVTMPVARGFYVTSPFGQRTGQYAGMHWGTDFGNGGGSGGHPIYAVKDGTVTRAGAATGFGQWITVDHPASNGGGLTVYGHIIPEVTVGQAVAEGQRIGRINPDSATNGGVAPHLHLEWHRYVWAQPGADRLDPMTKLAGAAWPGETTTTGGTVSTIFGPDVSYFQNGMSLVKAKQEGMSFVILRTNDGTFKDTCYASHYDDAKSAGLLIAAYAYIRNPSEGTSIAAQVQTTLQVMGDRKVPVWLDCETNAGLHVEHIREYKRRLEAAGVRVPGIYTYVPFWEGKVSPSEPGMGEFGYLWKAAYPGGTGTAAQVYSASGGDGSHNWTYPLGNRKPDLWQFTDRATIAGHTVDCNAFRGTVEQLRTIFYGGESATTPSEEDDMTDEDRALLRQIRDNTADCRAMLMTLSANALGDPAINGPFGGWPHDQIMASVREKIAAGKDLTNTEQLHVILDKLGFYNKEN